MKIRNLIIVIVSSVLSMSPVFAAQSNKTTIDIVIDSDFQNNNLFFTVYDPNHLAEESIGSYLTGHPLFIHQRVNSIDGFALPITAYVTNNITQATTIYHSTHEAKFSSSGVIVLSFPSMFTK